MKMKTSYFNVTQTLTWITVIGSLAFLIGIVLVATELFKFQQTVNNKNTVAGKNSFVCY